MVTVTDDDGGSQTRPFQVTVFEPSIVVDTLVDESDGDFSLGDLSLREAIERANLVTGPARITFAPALSGGRIQLVLGELIVTNSVDVDATDLPGGIIVDASGNDLTPASTRDDGDDTNDGDGSRVFNIDDGVPAHLLEVAIWGMTLTGGDVMGSGGAIRSVENLVIRSSTISGNQATDGGGGIAHSIGELTVAYSTIAANSASFGGGVANEGGMLTIDSSTISGNAASFGGVQGGGLIVGDDVVFVIDISGSTGSLFGGDAVGDLNNDGRANTILDAEIAAFLAVNQRLVDLGLGNLSMVGIVAFDTARFIQDMDRDLDGPQSFTTPLADSDGNGIRDVEDVLRSLQIGGGTDFEVGLAGAIEVINDAGIAPGNGNVIFLSDGVGSGNFFDEIETIRESLNLNLRAFGVGPGASLEQLQQIDPQAIRFSNTNELLGVFSGQNDGTGGGIWTSVAESRSTRISHSTITNNTADANSSGNGSGGGIFVAGSGSLVLDHSIVAANIDNSTIAPDVDAVSAGSNVTVTAEFSLIGRNTGSGLAATPIGRSDAFGNLIGTAAAPIDPLLGPLMNNGGRTPTHSLLPGSPALNAGDPDFMPPPDFDQRGAGFPRIRNGRIDIGALEGQVIVDTRQRQITPVVTPVPPVIETEPPTSDVRPTAIVQAVILPISDAGSGGGVPNQKRESPPLDRLAAAEIALRRALSRPQSVRRADVIDVVFSLGEVELASVLGIDMGDEPVYHHQTRKEEAEDEAGEPVAEVAELPPTIDPAPAEPVTPPVVESDGPPLTLWGAIAGSGMLWLGGTWWWLGRKRKRRLLG
jgi:hypothetical protein